MNKLAKNNPFRSGAKSALLAALALFATTASAGTVKVFAQYWGERTSLTSAQQTTVNNFLVNNNIDFGVFFGATAVFDLGIEGYEAVTTSTSCSQGKGRTLVYKASDWEYIRHYDLTVQTSYTVCDEGYVMQRKSTGEQYIFVMATRKSNDRTTACSVTRDYANGKQSANPTARILVAMPYNYGIKNDGNAVESGIFTSNNKYVRTLTSTSAGTVYAQTTNLLSHSGSAVSTFSGGDSKAVVATLAYQATYTIIFNDWDGTELKKEYVLEGADATPPADPTRENYHFTGWSGSAQNVQASATLTAQYAINTYTVRFLDYDGAVLDSQTIDHGSDATPPADPTRSGYRFTGWQGDYTGITADTDITATYVEDTAVTHWVTFKDWDGTQLSQQEVEEGEDATPPANPDTKTGWHFTGWSGNYTNVQQDETVTAQYAINTYTVTFQDWDETVLKAETVNHGADATPPADPERTGYTFTGWQGAYQNVAADSTVVAQYSINTYTVTFQYTNGTVIVQQTVDYLGSATKPANPAPLEEDTVFYRWDGTYTSITEDTTVTAIFIPNVIEIGTGAEFAEYMKTDLVTLSAVTFALTNDISLSGVTYSKPATFAATLDGRGHTLRNFPSHKDIKSLCTTLTGTIRDLCIADYGAPGNANMTSILAASAQGALVSGVVLSNCTWTIAGGSHGTSGLIYATSGNMTTITNCTMVKCKVTASNNYTYIGGFVGSASNLHMVDCHFIADDTNTVAVGNGITIAGALVGRCGSGVTIERCSNNAYVKVSTSGTEAAVGGLVGFATSSGSPTIKNCANFGAVESTVDTPAGGIIGNVGSASGSFSFTMQSCFNYGDVSSPLAAGGLVGSYRGATSSLVNSGSSGAVSSPAGFAGGLVGRLGYNESNKTAGFKNVMQAGAVSTESGHAGLLAGGLTGSTASGLTLVVSNAFMAGSAEATDGGTKGMLFGGRDTVSANEMSLVMDGSKVLESNASLPLYYNGANEQVAWDSPATFGASALTSWTIRNALNAYVSEHSGYIMWIQGENYPELETFGTAYISGFMILVR